LWQDVRFLPPGGTPRLYGRRDACRYTLQQKKSRSEERLSEN
jgi:hypothetical protein